MITEKIRMKIEERISKYSATPIYQRIIREGTKEIFDLIEKLEAQARIEAWKEGWNSAVEFGTEQYFCKADAENFQKKGTELLERMKKEPELILDLMPSILEHITKGTD